MHLCARKNPKILPSEIIAVAKSFFLLSFFPPAGGEGQGEGEKK